MISNYIDFKSTEISLQVENLLEILIEFALTLITHYNKIGNADFLRTFLVKFVIIKASNFTSYLLTCKKLSSLELKKIAKNFLLITRTKACATLVRASR